VPETFVIDADALVVLRFPDPVTDRVSGETIRAPKATVQAGAGAAP
jgi:hypothetical protein